MAGSEQQREWVRVAVIGAAAAFAATFLLVAGAEWAASGVKVAISLVAALIVFIFIQLFNPATALLRSSSACAGTLMAVAVLPQVTGSLNLPCARLNITESPVVLWPILGGLAAYFAFLHTQQNNRAWTTSEVGKIPVAAQPRLPLILLVAYWLCWAKTKDAQKRATAYLDSAETNSPLAALGESNTSSDLAYREGARLLLWGLPGVGKTYQCRRLAVAEAKAGRPTFFLRAEVAQRSVWDALKEQLAIELLAEARYVLRYRPCTVVLEDAHLAGPAANEWPKALEKITKALDDTFGINASRQVLATVRWTKPAALFPKVAAFASKEIPRHTPESARTHFRAWAGLSADCETPNFEEAVMQTELLLRCAASLVKENPDLLTPMLRWQAGEVLHIYLLKLCGVDEEGGDELFRQYHTFADHVWPDIDFFRDNVFGNLKRRPDLFVTRSGVWGFPHSLMGQYLVAFHAVRRDGQADPKLPPWRGRRGSACDMLAFLAELSSSFDQGVLVRQAFKAGLSCAQETLNAFKEFEFTCDRMGGVHVVAGLFYEAFLHTPQHDEPRVEASDVDWALEKLEDTGASAEFERLLISWLSKQAISELLKANARRADAAQILFRVWESGGGRDLILKDEATVQMIVDWVNPLPPAFLVAATKAAHEVDPKKATDDQWLAYACEAPAERLLGLSLVSARLDQSTRVKLSQSLASLINRWPLFPGEYKLGESSCVTITDRLDVSGLLSSFGDGNFLTVGRIRVRGSLEKKPLLTKDEYDVFEHLIWPRASTAPLEFSSKGATKAELLGAWDGPLMLISGRKSRNMLDENKLPHYRVVCREVTRAPSRR